MEKMDIKKIAITVGYAESKNNLEQFLTEFFESGQRVNEFEKFILVTDMLPEILATKKFINSPEDQKYLGVLLASYGVLLQTGENFMMQGINSMDIGDMMSELADLLEGEDQYD